MKKYKITYTARGIKQPRTGALEHNLPLDWFSQNAPQGYKIIGLDLINGDQFAKLDDLTKKWGKK